MKKNEINAYQLWLPLSGRKICLEQTQELLIGEVCWLPLRAAMGKVTTAADERCANGDGG